MKGGFIFVLICLAATLLTFLGLIGIMQVSIPQEDVYITANSAANQSGQYILSTGATGINILSPFLLFVAAIATLSFFLILFGRRK